MLLIVWGGVELLSDRVFSTLNPNAEMYTKPLKPSFDEEVLDTMSGRIRSSFPVLPSVFFELNPAKS